MIQRIQTVYLFFGALAVGALGLFDLPWNSVAASTRGWFVPVLIGLIIGTAGAALGAIFLYGNRKTQRTVVVGTQILTIVLAGVLYGGLYLTSELTLVGTEGIDWGRTTVLALPVVAYGLFFFARRGINHDIELIQSMDRLR